MRGLFSLYLSLFFAYTLLAQVPTAPSSNVIFGTTFCSQATVSWTNGNGNGRIVIARKGSPVTVQPAANTFYIAKDSFGLGYAFDATQFVVYNGTGNSVVVENLESNTTYYFAVFEFNGAGTTFSYRTAGYPEASVTTKNLTCSFTINDPYQCQVGNSSTFTSSITQTDAGPVTYGWNYGNGVKGTGANPTYSFPAKGIFNVKLTVNSYRCQAEFTKFDTIAPMPVALFELNADSANNTSTQCFLKPDGRPNFFWFKNKSTFTSLGTGFDYTNLLWTYGEGAPDVNLFDVKKSYLKPGDYKVKLLLSSSQNNIEFCSDSFEMNVKVLPKPIDSSLLLYDTAMCLNNNLFKFDYNSSVPGLTVVWAFGDGGTSSSRNSLHTYGAIGSYPVSLNVTDIAGCTDVYKDTVRVAPQPNNSVLGLKSQYCEGSTIEQLTPFIPGGTWIGDLNVATGEFMPSKLGINQIRYAVNSGGCKDTATVTTIVNEVPVFELGNDTSICAGTSFVKNIIGNGATMAWSTGATDSFTTADKAGILWVVKSKNGCVYGDSIIVKVIKAPSVNLGRDTLLCGDGNRTIDVRADEATYTWNDGYTGGGQRVMRSSGIYEVLVTNKCGSASDDVELTFLPFACQIFVPNAFSPNGDGLNDVFRPSGNVKILTMSIYSVWGEQLYEAKDGQFAWDGMYRNVKAPLGRYYFLIRYMEPTDGPDTPAILSGDLYLVN